MSNRVSLDSSIDELDVSVRTYNVLKNMNIKTVRDVVKCTEPQLLKERNFGRKSLSELNFELAMHGFRLGMPMPKTDEIEDLAKKINELSDAVFLLSMKLKNHIVSHEKLVRLHNDVARAVIKLEDNKPGGVMPPQIGVSLRDQFAIAILSGVTMGQNTIRDAEQFAKNVYLMADFMLKAREAK